MADIGLGRLCQNAGRVALLTAHMTTTHLVHGAQRFAARRRYVFVRRAVQVTALIVAFSSIGATLRAAQQTPTFSRDVAPLLYRHCATCHRPGEVGGFSLLSFADARPRAAAIARATSRREMPPWKAEAIDGADLLGARRLDVADIAIIQKWVEAGAPEGSPADLPRPPSFPTGWQLGEPDQVVSMTVPFVVLPGGQDQLRNFVIPVNLPAGRYVRGLEFRPGNARVVHHANIRVVRTDAARAADAADIEPGFDGRLNAGAEFPDGQFLGWTPGQLPPLLSGDSAWWLDAGSDLVVQLHLRPTEKEESVQVRIGLFFTSEVPRRTPVMVRLGKQDLDIAPGLRDYREDDAYTLPVAARLLAVQPHAHYRARDVTASVRLPDGSSRLLLHIPNWDFDWQDQYRYTQPIALPAGSILRMSFRYDNSPGNARNPDYPPRRVRWGQRSSDEMGDVWFQLLAQDDGARARLVEDSGKKVLAEDAVGFETLLETDPNNPRLHEAAAAILLTLNQPARGVAHLEAALALDPHSPEAHYNLATALAWQGRRDEAVAHLREALAADPGHVAARVNLGALLRAQGDRVGALRELQRALELAPADAAAHANLGGLLMQDGQVGRAVAEYRAALASRPTLVEALTELAWTFATSPDDALRNPVDAVALGERARRLTSNSDPRALDALAAAYAAAGRYADAVRVLDSALQLMEPAGVGADAARTLLRERRGLYRAGHPYRDSSRQNR